MASRSNRNTGKNRSYRGSGCIGIAPRDSFKPKFRIGKRRPFQRNRFPFDWFPKVKIPACAWPHPTKSGPGRL